MVMWLFQQQWPSCRMPNNINIPHYLTNVKHSPLDRSCDLSYSILFYSRLCPSTAIKALYQSPPSFSVLHYPCPYRSLLPHNVTSPFLCPLLSLSIPLPVAPQCHLSDLSLSLSFAILVHTAPCHPTVSPLPCSVLYYPCPYRSLLPHNVTSPFLCPSLSLSIRLPVAPQCLLSRDVLVFRLI